MTVFATTAVQSCRAKLRKDAKVREVYKFGKTLGTGGKRGYPIDIMLMTSLTP